MDTSDFIEFGVGLGFGNVMSQTIGSAFANAIDTRSAMHAITVPQTAQEIQALLDKLDVRLANGEISEAIFKALTAKWQARLQGLETPAP